MTKTSRVYILYSGGTQVYIREWAKQVGRILLGLPGYTSEYDLDSQVWYPSTPEFDQNSQVWYIRVLRSV